MIDLDLEWVRARFPALRRQLDGRTAVFLDAPGGTQVPQAVIDAMGGYLGHSNANTHGTFATSRETDQVIGSARTAAAAFLGCDAEEVVFGPNMTTLTFGLARSLGSAVREGDEVVVTCLDHDANIAPWRALEERGVRIRVADIRTEDCTLDLDNLERQITSRTRLVAFGYASNAVGTVNDVERVVRLAHDAGALAFVDAVHYAPHGPVDFHRLGCDFLACSPYKFYGPHLGILVGRHQHLASLRPYKVRPSSDTVPERWETGTQSHEALAGFVAAMDYLEELGKRLAPSAGAGRPALLAAMEGIRAHERRLVERLIPGLLRIRGLSFYGIRQPERFGRRTPTVAVRLAGMSPAETAARLGAEGCFVWDGNFYAVALTERLGLENRGGLVRIGLAHYNTPGEVDRFLDTLAAIATRAAEGGPPV